MECVAQEEAVGGRVDQVSLLIDPEELKAILVAIEAESIGWMPLGDGAYLHLGKPDEEDIVITVTGVPEVGMAGMNVLLVGW